MLYHFRPASSLQLKLSSGFRQILPFPPLHCQQKLLYSSKCWSVHESEEMPDSPTRTPSPRPHSTSRSPILATRDRKLSSRASDGLQVEDLVNILHLSLLHRVCHKTEFSVRVKDLTYSRCLSNHFQSKYDFWSYLWKLDSSESANKTKII